VSQVARILAAELADASTWQPPGQKSALDWRAFETPRDETAFLDTLSENALAGLAWLFEFWALPHQCPPEGDWRTWVVLGGRGAGKTRAGTEWVRAQVEGSGPEDAGTARRVALIGETYDQAVAVMVKGDSGLLACSPPDRRPRWVSSERRLVWPNGAEARVYSANDPEALRGPQFDCAWADEFGCPAIDKGSNEPNTFLDPKSAESRVPHFSTGRRDDVIQAQYLRAVLHYWSDPATNPVSEVYGGPMIDVSRAHAWAWDARPWPAFPHDLKRWSDGENWQKGHWLTGRLDAAPLDLVVAEICEAAGAHHYDVSGLHGLVRGHVSGQTETARAALQPLMIAYGFDAVETEGKLTFRAASRIAGAELDEPGTALSEEGAGGVTQIRAAKAETIGRLRIGYTDAEASYDDRVASAVFPGDGTDAVTEIGLPLALIPSEAIGIAERRLAEARVARDSLNFSLPPSMRYLGAGEIVSRPDGSTWRIDRVLDRSARDVQAVRVEPSTAEPSDITDAAPAPTSFLPPLPVFPIFMDLPLLSGEEQPHAPHIAVAATPWPGEVAVYKAPGPDGFTLNRLIDRGAVAGTLLTPLPAALPGLWDRGAPVRVRIASGALSSAETEAVLNGANVAAIGTGDGAGWEVLQFGKAELVAEEEWDISLRLRGQAGSDADMPSAWPEGSLFVLLDGAVTQVDLPASARGLARHWRVGPARRALDDPSYVERVLAFDGIGLRPLRPVHLRARTDGGDVHLSWIRRARIDADSWTGPDVPLGEATEAYHLRVTDASGLRREAGTATPSFTYSVADRLSDGTLSPFSIEVAQVSDRFGPGPYARIDIND
jgi:hypothetical protein